MKRAHIIVLSITIIVIIYSFVLYTDSARSTIDSYTPKVESYRESFLYNPVDLIKSNEDFSFAILGTDERKTEKSRSDVIMLLKYIAKENRLIVVSIPRDSRVSIFGRGLAKINAASAFGGAQMQIDALEKLFKISDLSYLHVNFEGFVKIIDAIGGVEINAEKDFVRDWGKKNTYAVKGRNILLGDDLLEYVRFRHDGEGDFGRIKRQQEVLLSSISNLLKPRNIVKLPKLALLVAKNTDSNMNIFFIMKHINQLKNLDSLTVEFHTLKTTSERCNGIWYELIDETDLKLISDLLQN
jgi:LCP family protein required for cell wall assembly